MIMAYQKDNNNNHKTTTSVENQNKCEAENMKKQRE